MRQRNGSPLDLSAQVTKVREKAKPWKSIIALVLAIAAITASKWARFDLDHISHFDHLSRDSQLIRDVTAPGGAAAFGIFGSMATYGLSGQVHGLLVDRAGESHAAIVRYFLILIGAFTTLVLTLELFSIPVGQLVLGGALTSVFVGIAAQQALSNVFAGIVLLLARPFKVGDHIRMRAGALGGQFDGIVTDIGITYVRLNTGGSVMSVPNSQVLNAMVGPVPHTPPPDITPSPDGSSASPATQAPTR